MMADGYSWYDLRRVDAEFPDGTQTTIGTGLVLPPNRPMLPAVVTSDDLPALLRLDQALYLSAHLRKAIDDYMRGREIR